jgi:signal transduction histidine kinase
MSSLKGPPAVHSVEAVRARPESGAASSRRAALTLLRLREIGVLLAGMETVETTFFAVADRLASILSLATATLVRRGSVPAAIWWAGGRRRAPGSAARPLRRVSLPLAADEGTPLGLLHLDVERLDAFEHSLAAVVAQQLAVALRRREVVLGIEARRIQERQGREEAEASNRAKDEFLTLLAHELRTPLNAILGWVRLLESGRLSPLQQARAVETIGRNGELQKELIADILDFQSIVSGRLRLDDGSFDLSDVVDRARDAQWPLAEAKRAEIRIDLQPGLAPLPGDGARVRQVVGNLLSNAIKFGSVGGHVDLRVRASGDGHVELTVSDDGPGIPVAFLPYLFDRFRQATEGRGRRYGGLGVGLTIAHRLVALHGGTLSAANRREGGAVFTLRLPTAAPVIVGAPPRAASLPAAAAPAEAGTGAPEALTRSGRYGRGVGRG